MFETGLIVPQLRNTGLFLVSGLHRDSVCIKQGRFSQRDTIHSFEMRNLVIQKLATTLVSLWDNKNKIIQNISHTATVQLLSHFHIAYVTTSCNFLLSLHHSFHSCIISRTYQIDQIYLIYQRLVKRKPTGQRDRERPEIVSYWLFSFRYSLELKLTKHWPFTNTIITR